MKSILPNVVTFKFPTSVGGTNSPSCNHLLSARFLATYRARLFDLEHLTPPTFFPRPLPLHATKSLPVLTAPLLIGTSQERARAHICASRWSVLGSHKIRRSAWRRWCRKNVTLKLFAYPLPHGFHRKLHHILLDCCASLLTFSISSP